MIERASSIPIQACFDTAWARSSQPKQATSGVSLSLWGVPLATSITTQASRASSLAEAELYAMGRAVHHSLHLKSFLQQLQLSQLAKPFELTVFSDSSSGEALVSKLGLTRKNKHVQLRYLFRHEFLAGGQLNLSKIPSGKNPADALAQHPPVKPLSRDKGKRVDTQCYQYICPFRPTDSLGPKGQMHCVSAPFPLSRERGFTRYMGNP